MEGTAIPISDVNEGHMRKSCYFDTFCQSKYSAQFSGVVGKLFSVLWSGVFFVTYLLICCMIWSLYALLLGHV
jgi:hypothetical protein